MTSKTVYLASDKQKMQNEQETFHKNHEKKKKYTRGFDSDHSDVNLEGDIALQEFEEDNLQH